MLSEEALRMYSSWFIIHLRLRYFDTPMGLKLIISSEKFWSVAMMYPRMAIDALKNYKSICILIIIEKGHQ